ncbi:extracellular solute-binding protein [Fimbriimonas ginsengisoli]|uniref:Sugar ABC transporter, sugar-binding protein n=1 Tax=Fimbriimonas ginsengisoli Gsoil 348 TaxID=661478 RepID=A0A068NWW8_FIMGI|nr:extracellular solute-binding protein [Fimbriimonas ginsengisoli]AIE86079.1 Sugar ABC transporter, sugar-binding protein [Fimbriimonas ginsengisoli Gsoil 348]
MTGRAAAGFGLAAIGLAITFALSEKATSRQADASKVTVVYWEKWTGSEGEEMRKVVDAFNRSQNKIFVRYLTVSGVDSKTMLATAGGNPPDVAGIWADQLCQFSDAKALTDLMPMALANGLGPDYYIKNYWDALTYRGGLWALPSTPASIALHVRTDLVPKEVASPETFPKTIEDFDKLVFRISKKRPDGSLEMAGFLPSSPGWWNWAWSPYFGGKLVVGDKITVDSPEAERAFTWIASYAKKFGSKEVQSFQSGFGGFASPQDPFMTGKTATEMNGVWKANYIDVYKKGVKWFAVPFPYPADHPELQGHTNLSQDVLAIPRGAKHAKEAFEFIRYVQRQDVMEGLCTRHGKNSPLNKVSEAFFKNHPNKFIRLFDQLARSPKAINPPQIGLYPQINAELGVAFQSVNTGQKEPKEALAEAQARLDGLWATYRTQVLDR